MGSLNDAQKHLLFDHCMGVASDREHAAAEALIATNAEAAEFYYQHLKVLLSPLDSVEIEPCPDLLVDRTVQRLRQAAETAPGAPVPLAPEPVSQTTIPLSTWRPPVQIAAVAAIVLFLLSVALPSLRLMRLRAFRAQCQTQLGGIYQGLSDYVADHDSPPTVTTVAGDPWWKVGYQGKENHSNTRPVWLLAKNGYVQPDTFICPGRQRAKAVNFKDVDIQGLNDFPCRDSIDYSFRISCAQTRLKTSGKSVLMADLNPLSEKLPSDYSKPMKMRLDESILNSNSANHLGRGQNVMLGSGAVQFNRTRLDSAQDDIFSLQTMSCGSELRGCETPSCDTDAFLAP